MKSLRPFVGFLSFALVLFVADFATAQRGGGQQAGAPGTVTRVQWSDDGQSVEFTSEGERFRLDLESGEKASLGMDPQAQRGRGGRGGRGARGRGRGRGGRGGRGGQAAGDPTVATTGTRVGPAPRGRQYEQVDSPDGIWEAHYRDWNVVLVQKSTSQEMNIRL